MSQRYFLKASLIFSALIFLLDSCNPQAANPTQTASPAPTEMLQIESVVTHPELQVISRGNVQELEQVGQWGQGNVFGIALSPDGSVIAVSTSTGIYLYDRVTVAQVDYIDIKISAEIRSDRCPPSKNLAFSPDGSILAIADSDITLWDIKAGTIHAVIENKIDDPVSTISEIQFSPDGSRIVGVQKVPANGIGCYMGWGSLVIYNVETNDLIFRYDYQRYEEVQNIIYISQHGVVSFAFEAHQADDCFLQVDWKSGILLAQKTSCPMITSMNDTIALVQKWTSTGEGIGDGYSHQALDELNSFEEIEILDGTARFIPRTDLIFISNQQYLTVHSLDGTAICSEFVGEELDQSFLPDVFSADGTIALSWNYNGGHAGDVRVWDLEKCTVSEPILTFPEVDRQMSISADGLSLLTGSAAGHNFHVFDVETGNFRYSLSGYDAEFSADGKLVYVVEDDSITAYDSFNGEFFDIIVQISSDYMTDLTVSPGGQFLIIEDESVSSYQVINLDRNTPNINIPDEFLSLYFSPDGKFMAATRQVQGATRVLFWDLTTGDYLMEWRGLVPDYKYGSVSFDPEFSLLVTCGSNGDREFLYLWNVPGFELNKVLALPPENYTQEIRMFQFSPNGHLMVARGSNPIEFLFWDVGTGELLHHVAISVTNDEWVNHPYVFSPDGRLLLILGGDGTVHVWGVE